MIIEIDFRCVTAAAIPSRDEPPLAVDADRVKSLQLAAQLLEVVAGLQEEVWSIILSEHLLSEMRFTA
ncbi:hypothetical protein WN73_14655 [Bradyrhizobium sp. CCBAU 45394]|nr:hypothetical protein [Bradyrhizobium sp. CCBAU 45394]MDA9537340.1 hypothetical protein [Bradyrhizobium sp. CCBAU 21362]